MATEERAGIEKLNETNWFNWKFLVKVQLEEKKLWKVVEKEPANPLPDADKDNNIKALALITRLIGSDQVTYIRHAKTAHAAWKALEEVHEKGGFANRLFLWRKFITTRMEQGTSMKQHITNVT